MAMTSDRDVASRLARAIAADIRLYNEAAIASGRSLAPEIEEGRQLFRARVVESLHAIYEEETASLQTASSRSNDVATGPAASAAPAVVATPRPAPIASTPEPGSSDPTSGRVLVAIVVLVVLFVAIAWTAFGPR